MHAILDEWSRCLQLKKWPARNPNQSSTTHRRMKTQCARLSLRSYHLAVFSSSFVVFVYTFDMPFCHFCATAFIATSLITTRLLSCFVCVFRFRLTNQLPSRGWLDPTPLDGRFSHTGWLAPSHLVSTHPSVSSHLASSHQPVSSQEDGPRRGWIGFPRMVRIKIFPLQEDGAFPRMAHFKICPLQDGWRILIFKVILSPITQ